MREKSWPETLINPLSDLHAAASETVKYSKFEVILMHLSIPYFPSGMIMGHAAGLDIATMKI
ncbi:MAG: hypothetical protein EPO08_06930 [Rhodospirillaceae bacterium]|nr:MAG: hypothetical protein EPO08_06930 [Rhodospirillaceae bacterium]